MEEGRGSGQVISIRTDVLCANDLAECKPGDSQGDSEDGLDELAYESQLAAD